MDVAAITTQARSLTGRPAAAEDGFISDAEILRWINRALDELSMEECFTVTLRIPLLEDQTEYVLYAKWYTPMNDVPFKIENTDGKEYPIELLPEKHIDALVVDAVATYTVFSTGANIIARRRENKIQLMNFTPSSDDTSRFIVARGFIYHEELTETTDTPFRLKVPEHQAVLEYAIARIWEKDEELEQMNTADGKFYGIWVPRITKRIQHNKPKMGKVPKASQLRRGFVGVMRG